MAKTAIKALSIGDRVRLKPQGVGKITDITPISIVEGANVLVEWRNESTQEIGSYIGNNEDFIDLA